MTKRTEFAERLRQTRILKGLTQTFVAEKAGLSQSAYGEAETTGKSSTKIAQLAEVLGVDPAWLATGEGAADKAPPVGWPFKRVTPQQIYALRPEYARIVENLTLSLIELQSNVSAPSDSSYKGKTGGPVTFGGAPVSPEMNHDGTDSQDAAPTDQRRTSRGS